VDCSVTLGTETGFVIGEIVAGRLFGTLLEAPESNVPKKIHTLSVVGSILEKRIPSVKQPLFQKVPNEKQTAEPPMTTNLSLMYLTEDPIRSGRGVD